MKKLTLTNYKKIFVTGLLFSVCVSAQAFQVLLDGTGTNALYIKNLDIGGTVYDVSFVSTLAPNNQSCPNYPCDAFDGDKTGAELAAEIIARALNEDPTLNPVGGNGNPVAITVGELVAQNAVLVPWLYEDSSCFNAPQNDGTCTAAAVPSGGAGTWEPIFGTFEASEFGTFEFARFSPGGTVVPVPPAAWLFGSALGLLGWVRRRTRLAAVSRAPEGSDMV